MNRPYNTPALLALAVIIAGCSSSRKASEETSPPAYTGAMREYESQFKPSDYDEPVSSYFETPAESTVMSDPPGPGVPEKSEAEIVQGFRVQILSTTSIDEANRRKADAEGLFPDDWFYVVYDPPTYKVRAGNFLRRVDADRFIRSLFDYGFKDSWIVPDKVFKNIPPRSKAPDFKIKPRTAPK